MAAQAAAETLKQRAQALKDSASQALQSHKDLTASLQRARAEVQTLQAEQKELTRKNIELEASLAASQREHALTQGTLSTVQQQLTLYMMALEETRRGADLEQLQSMLTSVMANPGAEEALREELKRAGEEVHSLRLAFERAGGEMNGLRLAFERSQAEIASLQVELRARDEMLSDKEREYLAIYGELDLTKSLVQEMRRGAESSERLLAQHQRSQDLLREKEAAVTTLESEVRCLLREEEERAAAYQRDVDALQAEKRDLERRLEMAADTSPSSQELENLKETIVLLEDQISDLEIVNSELYQRLAELEGPG